MLSLPNISQFHVRFFIFVSSLSSLYGGLSIETDTITSTSPVRDPGTITSCHQMFKLGFYTPENTTDRYMCIFHAVEKTPVWIANRDNPLKDSSGMITISKEGNLVLLNGENEVVWSTNITQSHDGNRNPKKTTAQILDTGNMVLYDNSTGKVLWESFSNPSHAWMQTMPLIDDTRTGNRVMLSSWKNVSDPGIGSFKFGLQAMNIPQLFIWHSTGQPHYRSGPWNGQIFIGSRPMYRNFYSRGVNIIEVSPGIFRVVAGLHENSLFMIVLNSSGRSSSMMWNDNNKNWDTISFTPQYECDIYGKCGAFGVCDDRDSPKICSCLRGFEPVQRQEWENGNWSSGCKRKTELQCKNNRGNEDGFLRLRNVKVPDYSEQFVSSNEEECKIRCLQNCSCIAYSHDSYGIGCMFWREKDALIDTQQYPNFGADLYIRLAASELDDKKDTTLFIVVPVSVITFSVLVLIFIARGWMLKKKGGKTKERDYSKANVALSLNSTAIFLQDESKGPINIQELPLFSFETLVIATNQFNDDNLIGKGGFGHVYKGKLMENGKDIAVKRLSEASSQGIEEFLNEVYVISKLQHRNLVGLMGCCVEKEEKMLVYEYMTNKSLDICLFDHSHPSRKVLDWEKRLNIIKGIGQGLVYLHRDSRLRIIHRDLKASNVLLDQEWRPKISDFGMARIFTANQDRANTLRVVGTYGYMAPEYAAEGVFSEKSDVYSFGVLMLEIISGTRNTRYYNDDLSSSLLGCAWKFLKEDYGVAFPDQDILNPNSPEEIIRCIHIALLCVQEFAEARPTVQSVLSMLDGEIANLPMPEQPVLAEKWNSTQSKIQTEHSISGLTVTELHGR